MRLLTEAAGQVLTRNVAADRRRVLARDRRRILRMSRRSLEVDADADGESPAENRPESARPRTRRASLTSTS